MIVNCFKWLFYGFSCFSKDLFGFDLFWFSFCEWTSVVRFEAHFLLQSRLPVPKESKNFNFVLQIEMIAWILRWWPADSLYWRAGRAIVLRCRVCIAESGRLQSRGFRLSRTGASGWFNVTAAVGQIMVTNYKSLYSAKWTRIELREGPTMRLRGRKEKQLENHALCPMWVVVPSNGAFD